MKSVLSGIYHGKLNPQDIFFHDKAFRDLRGGFSERKEAFSSALSQEQAERMGELLDNHAELLLYEVEANFQNGFCLGVLLMLEVMQIMDTNFQWGK